MGFKLKDKDRFLVHFKAPDVPALGVVNTTAVVEEHDKFAKIFLFNTNGTKFAELEIPMEVN
jgi:hypothetical protein